MTTIKPTKNATQLAALNEEVQTLHHQLYPQFFKPFEGEPIEGALGQMLAQDDIKAFIAYHDQEPVAYVLCNIKRRPENAFQHASASVYIDQIMVKASHQKQGIGQKLLEAVKSLAKAENIDLIQLDHWTKNEGARVFFQRHGFAYYNEKMALKV